MSNDINYEHIPNANNFTKHTDASHAYEIPDMYIGSIIQAPRNERVLEKGENNSFRFLNKLINIPEGAERLFLEILSNAGDNVPQSRKTNINPGVIRVHIIENKYISIYNEGCPIPIEFSNFDPTVLIPTVIFSHFKTSSNYNQNEDRIKCGRNGMGAKLTNLFSKYFSLEVNSHIHKRSFKQIWVNNMKEATEPEIGEYDKDFSSTTITYQMDFEKFGYLDNQYNLEFEELYRRHCVDTSFTCGIPVYFNNESYDMKDAKIYAKFYTDISDSNCIYYQELPPEAKEIVETDKGKKKKRNTMANIDLLILDTPNRGEVISFVNGIFTKYGGIHVDEVYKKIFTGILEQVNGKTVNQNKKKQIKNEKKNDKPLDRPLLTISHIKQHVTIILSCRVDKPKFDSQTKSKLTSPKISININEKLINGINNWNLLDMLHRELEFQNFKLMTKHDGKKTEFIPLASLVDANWAGTDKSRECILCLTEGDSALGYPRIFKGCMEGDDGPNKVGMYPLKGKPLNIMKASISKIIKNEEFNDLKTILGLQESLDYSYPENLDTLRYGSISIFADSDEDGLHIIGLLILYFYQRFPTLVLNFEGYNLNYIKTPIIRVYKGNKTLKFYYNYDYEEWKNSTPDYEKWGHNYYKGLGSSERHEVEDDFKNQKFIYLRCDENTPESMNLAFSSKLADLRKDWIANYINSQPQRENIQTVTDFIRLEMVKYCRANLERSIPHFMDGLKDSQRKALWGGFDEFKTLNTDKRIKTSNLANSVSNLCAYKHGETSMCETIIKMAQDFIGTNNLPIFKGRGDFGSRMGNKPASPRYTHISPPWWWKFIFKKEDRDLLELRIDEGEKREPNFFLPVIPLHLLNGASGIGSGHSTLILSHNPFDICKWLLFKLNDQKYKQVLTPWYRGFTGQIFVTTKNESNVEIALRVEKDSDNLDSEDDISVTEENDSNLLCEAVQDIGGYTHGKNTKRGKKLVANIVGSFEHKNSIITITEIPIGISENTYLNYIKYLKVNKKISSFENFCGLDNIKFILKGFKTDDKTTVDLRKLKLIRSLSMTNMILLDYELKPKKFDSVEDILESFYTERLKFYQKRKDLILSKLLDEINKMTELKKFIILVISGEIKVFENKKSVKEELVLQQMDIHNINRNIFDLVKLNQLTEEKVKELEDKVFKKYNEFNSLKDLDPKSIWAKEIEEFLIEYKKQYKE